MNTHRDDKVVLVVLERLRCDLTLLNGRDGLGQRVLLRQSRVGEERVLLEVLAVSLQLS